LFVRTSQRNLLLNILLSVTPLSPIDSLLSTSSFYRKTFSFTFTDLASLAIEIGLDDTFIEMYDVHTCASLFAILALITPTFVHRWFHPTTAETRAGEQHSSTNMDK
tara:strand:+ start:4903 stop:5223 length:321 start_codon:yes stop_codon:yes gene_type:complete